MFYLISPLSRTHPSAPSRTGARRVDLRDVLADLIDLGLLPDQQQQAPVLVHLRDHLVGIGAPPPLPAGALRHGLHEIRERVEVEAESVAFVVCDTLGVDSADYSIPYVASWAAGDPERIQEAAQSVLTTGRKIITGIEAERRVETLDGEISAAKSRMPSPPPPSRRPWPPRPPATSAARSCR